MASSLLANSSLRISRLPTLSVNQKRSLNYPQIGSSTFCTPSNVCCRIEFVQNVSSKSGTSLQSESRDRMVKNSALLFSLSPWNNTKPNQRRKMLARNSSSENVSDDQLNNFSETTRKKIEEINEIKREMDDIMNTMYSHYTEVGNEEERKILDSLKALMDVKTQSINDLLDANNDYFEKMSQIDLSKLRKSTETGDDKVEEKENINESDDEFLNDERVKTMFSEIEKLTLEIQTAIKNFSQAESSTEKLFAAQSNFLDGMEETEKNYLQLEHLLQEISQAEQNYNKDSDMGTISKELTNGDANENTNFFPEQDTKKSRDGKDVFEFLRETGEQDPETFQKIDQIRNLKASASLVQLSKEELAELQTEAEELKTDLQQLADEIMHLWRGGDEENALVLLNENLVPLKEQCEQDDAGVPQAAMLSTLTQVYFWIQKDEEAVQLLKQTVDLVEDIPDGLPLMDSILENLADIFYSANNLTLAISYYLRSIANQQILANGITVEQTATMASLSRALYRLKEFDYAIDVQNEIIEIQTEHLGDLDPNVGFSYISLVHMLLDSQKFDAAEDACRKAIRIFDSNKEVSSLNTAIAFCTLSNVKESRGQIDEAIELLKKGIHIMEENENVYPEHDALIASRTSLAEIYDQCGRSKEAQIQWLEVLVARENVLGSDHPDLINPLLAYASSLILSENFEDAEPLCSRAYELALESSPSKSHSSLILPLQRLALCRFKTNNLDSAESLSRQALNICESSLDNNNYDGGLLGECCSQLAAILHAQGRDMEAETLLWRSLKNQEQVYGSQSFQIVPTLEALIVVLHCLDKTEEIRPLAQRLNVIKSSSSFA